MTTSPSLTGVPVAAMLRICIGPPTAGATSAWAFNGLRSPVACTTTGTSPFATRAVGITLPSVWTPCIGEDTMTATTIAMTATPASDQPKRFRICFVMTASLHCRNWILQRHAIARLHAFAHDELLLAAPRDPYQSFIPTAARPLDVGDRTSVLFQNRARGNQDCVGHSIDGHSHCRVHARPQARIHLIELHHHVEVALGRPVGKIDARERTDVVDLSGKLPVGHGVRSHDDA